MCCHRVLYEYIAHIPLVLRQQEYVPVMNTGFFANSVDLFLLSWTVEVHVVFPQCSIHYCPVLLCYYAHYHVTALNLFDKSSVSVFIV